MANLNPTLSFLTLNINGLSILIKRHRLKTHTHTKGIDYQSDKTQNPNYLLSKTF